MARSFSQFLLAAAVAVAVGGGVLAQSTPLQEAATLLRVGKKDEAAEKLRQIIVADPSSADALAMYRSISQDEWYLLMTHKDENGQPSDIQKIAQSILDRAKVQAKQHSRDEAAIAPLVATATAKDSDYATRQGAVNKLIANHGEFAVPALLEKLGNADDNEGQVQAIMALHQIGANAVLPLIEALKSGNEVAVKNAAAALFHIGDHRALAAMAQLANDDRVPVREIAKKFVEKFGAGEKGNAVDLWIAQAKQYLKGIVPVGAYSDVVWSLKDDKLVATDVPSTLYASELAKQCAAEAVRLAPSSIDACSMLAQANLGQATLIDTAIAQGDTAVKALEPVSAELKVTALALGLDAVRAALDAGVRDNLVPVAIGAIQVLAKAESVDSVEQSSLLGALKSDNKAIRYAAAEALVRASGGVKVPQLDAVVAVLADAVTEEQVRTIQIIGPIGETRPAVEATSKGRGTIVDASDSAIDGMRKLLTNPTVDVVVINEILPDRMPEDVIGNIKKDSRMANAKIVIVAKDDAAAKTRFGDSVGVIKAPLTGENLVAAVNTALEGVANAGNARAEGYASKASEGLLAIAANKGAINGALANLTAQLNRGDNVAVPAAKALGFAGGAAELKALVGTLGGAGSIELKKAAALASGSILARLGNCPDDVAAALFAALEAATDAGLREALATAIGKAHVPGPKKAELLKKLERIATPPAAGGS
jgi:HEAT repeat protein